MKYFTHFDYFDFEPCRPYRGLFFTVLKLSSLSFGVPLLHALLLYSFVLCSFPTIVLSALSE